MKRFINTPLLIALACTLHIHAGSLAGIGTQWAKLLDACPPDMGISLCKNTDALFYLSATGSSVGSGGTGFEQDYVDPTASIYFNGQLIATGAAYQGSGFNNNLSIIKTDLNGNFQWTVYSTGGDMMSNNGGVVSDGQGGVFVSCVIRHTDNLRTQPITLVDATGATTVINWTLATDETPRFYQGLLLRITGQGAIDWHRLIEVSNAPQPAANDNNADATTTAFYIPAMTGDGQGNFYLAMRYCNPVTFLNAQGQSTTFTPHNTQGWTGDSQESRGDLLVARFNAQGLLTHSLITTGTAQLESSPALAMSGNDLILNFVATGNGTDDIALDGTPVGLAGNNQASMITARLSNNLKIKWLQHFKGEMTGNRPSVMQYNLLSVTGNNLWITGMGNFKLSSADGTQSIETATGNVREGFVIKCDLTDGHWVKATTSRMAFPDLKAITGYFGAFESQDDDNVYLYGYAWNGSGISITSLDQSTLQPVEMQSIISGGSMPTAQCCIATGNKLYTMSRGRDQGMESQYLCPINSDIALSTLDWAVCLAAFELPFTVKEDTAMITGDVNADGSVNVSDVTMLVNMILGIESLDRDRANVNGDNDVNVSDVTALINIILGL